MIWCRPFLCLLWSLSLSAYGYTELGASANYRRSAFDHDNFQELISYTASVSYYFLEMSALELSYTDGYSQISVKPVTSGAVKTTTEADFDLLALDLVFSLANRDDVLQPYVKVGGGYLKKEVYQRIDGGDKSLISRSEGLVPSGGAGIKFMLTKQLSFMLGLDIWTTPPTEHPVVVDYAARAGVSWLL